MRVKDCRMNKEHCPYCVGHDTLALGVMSALVRGDTHWCGSCHRTFTEDAPAGSPAPPTQETPNVD